MTDISNSDLLTLDDLCELAGVGPKCRTRETKICQVLNSAGIFYWRKIDGTIGTTWHHVHLAGQKTAANQPSVRPNFAAVK